MLDIIKINNSQYATVRITGGDTKFTGILQNDFNISGRNNFDTGFVGSDLIRGAIEKKAELQRTVTFITGGRAGGDVSGTIPELTRNNWTGSERPSFQVNVALIALKDDEENNVIRRSNQMMRFVFPDRKKGLFVAPLGYNPGNAQGTVSLEIGKWFKADRLIVMSADFVHSKVCLKSGRPLYSTGTITLQPYQAITYREFQAYFKV